jgi:hypothetical protein
MREEGSRDSVKIEGGRLAYRPGYGFKVGLCATAPNYVFAFLMLLGLVLGVSVDAEGALVESAGRGVWTVGYSIISMIQSMYTGVLKILFADFSAFASIVGATVAYLIICLRTRSALFSVFAFSITVCNFANCSADISGSVYFSTGSCVHGFAEVVLYVVFCAVLPVEPNRRFAIISSKPATSVSSLFKLHYE